MRSPLMFTKSEGSSGAATICGRMNSTYSDSALMAAGYRGIILSFSRLRQRMKPAGMFTSVTSREMSSLTRMPVAYSSSSIALSR